MAADDHADQRGSGKLPVRWLIRIDLETGILALASSLTIFVPGNWLGAGEQVAAGAAILVGLWMAATAVVLLESEKRGRLTGHKQLRTG